MGCKEKTNLECGKIVVIFYLELAEGAITNNINFDETKKRTFVIIAILQPNLTFIIFKLSTTRAN